MRRIVINNELWINESGTLMTEDEWGVQQRVDEGALLTGTYPPGFQILRRFRAIGGGEVIVLRHTFTNHVLRYVDRNGERWWEDDRGRVGDPADIDRVRELINRGYGNPERWSAEEDRP